MRLALVLLLMLTACEMTSDLAGCNFAREVSVFPVACEGKVVANFCQGKLGVPLNRATFVAFPDRQEVVHRQAGIVTRLDNCTVQDWRTWTCASYTSDGQVTRSMDRGEFNEYDPPQGPLTPSWVYVSAWRYYWQRFTWKPSG
jgi:hypothetical protein